MAKVLRYLAAALQAANGRGAFAATTDLVRGQGILLVDDVLTSGATMVEAARSLYAAGAVTVIGCPIAVNPSEINYDPNYELRCPRAGCDGTMRIRFASGTEGAFWGCDRRRAGGDGCGEMMKFDVGLAAANRLSNRDSIMVFAHTPF